MGVEKRHSHVKFTRTIRLGKNVDLDNAVAGSLEVGSLRDTGTFIERWDGTEWQKIGPGLWISNIGDVTTSPVTLDLNDDVVLVDATSGNITINLPTAASAKGKVYIVKKINTTYTVTVDPDGSETIDGASTASLTSINTSREFYSDGTEWWIR